MRAFAFQWRRDTWEQRTAAYSGQRLPYCGSEQFKRAHILPGDLLYVVGFSEQREELLVIGRFEVASKAEWIEGGSSRESCLTHEEARTLLGEVYGVPLYEADWYLLPRKGTATRMRFDQAVPVDPPLTFIKPNGEVRQLFLDPDGRVNPQAVRSVSRLRPNTIKAFDGALDS